MLLSGFTFIRNASKYDFPILECIESMLPIVDELVVNVGDSEDDTEALVRLIASPKIKVVRSKWDDSKTEKGLVLSEQTNIALDACQGRWCLYLQADEALHENEHSKIRSAVETADRLPIDKQPEGFRLKYLHFYNGYTLIQRPWNWYPSEIRIIRKNSGARSYGDAQTFRGPGDRLLEAKTIDAHVFHYGHARAPEKMLTKINYFHRFWHGDSHGKNSVAAYKPVFKDLVWYWGSHPKPYSKRLDEGRQWSLTPNALQTEKPDCVVIFSDREHKHLADFLKNRLSQAMPSAKIVVVDSLREWVSAFWRTIFRKKKNAVIDLCAEDRSTWQFFLWFLDALLGFSVRVANSPRGTLSKSRRWVYTAVNWGCHEERGKGFAVPQEYEAKQLGRWIGVEF